MPLTEPAEELLAEVVREGAEMEMRRDDDPARRVLLALTRSARVQRGDGGDVVVLRPVIVGPTGNVDVVRMTARTFPVEDGDVIDAARGLVGLRVRGGRYVVVRPVSKETVQHLRAWDLYWVQMPPEARAAAAALVPGR